MNQNYNNPPQPVAPKVGARKTRSGLNKKIFVSELLTAEQVEKLGRMVPRYELVHKLKTNCGHPFLAAASEVYMRHMLDGVYNDPGLDKTTCRFVDVGGRTKYRTLWRRIYAPISVHTMAPLVTSADVVRRSLPDCTHTFETCDCLRPKDVLVFRHSLYYVPLAKLAGVMTKYDITDAVAVLHLPRVPSLDFPYGEGRMMTARHGMERLMTMEVRGSGCSFSHPSCSWLDTMTHIDVVAARPKVLCWEVIRYDDATQLAAVRFRMVDRIPIKDVQLAPMENLFANMETDLVLERVGKQHYLGTRERSYPVTSELLGKIRTLSSGRDRTASNLKAHMAYLRRVFNETGFNEVAGNDAGAILTSLASITFHGTTQDELNVVATGIANSFVQSKLLNNLYSEGYLSQVWMATCIRNDWMKYVSFIMAILLMQTPVKFLFIIPFLLTGRRAPPVALVLCILLVCVGAEENPQIEPASEFEVIMFYMLLNFLVISLCMVYRKLWRPTLQMLVAFFAYREFRYRNGTDFLITILIILAMFNIMHQADAHVEQVDWDCERHEETGLMNISLHPLHVEETQCPRMRKGCSLKALVEPVKESECSARNYGPVYTNLTPLHVAKTVTAEYRALRTRVTCVTLETRDVLLARARVFGSSLVDPWDVLKHWVVTNKSRLYPQLEKFRVMPYEEWIERYTGAQRRRYERAYESLLAFPLCRRDFRRTFFIKTELLMAKLGHAIPYDTDPRIISATSDRAQVVIGRWIVSVSKYLEWAWNGTKVPILYAAGVKASERLNKLVQTHTNYGETDGRRWDLHTREEALSFVRWIYKEIFQFPEWMNKHLISREKIRGPSKFWYVRSGPVRSSGDPDTGVGNTTLNGLISLFALDVCNGNVFGSNTDKVAVLGDDGLPVTHLPVDPVKYSAVFRSFGYDMKVSFRNQVEKVTFCSKLFVPVNVSGEIKYVIAPMLGKLLCRVGWTMSRQAKWDATVTGLVPLINHCPISRALVRTATKLGDVGPTHWLTNDQVFEATQESFEFICTRYSISQDDIDRLEREIASWKPYQVFNDSLVEHLLLVDRE